MYAVGLMSGTSLDGIDAVLCDISGASINTKIKEIAFCTMEIPKQTQDKIRKCCANEASVELVCSLNFELGELFALAVKKVCAKAQIESKNLGFIASHGQTIYHIPKPYGEMQRSTLQIGESAVIAQRCSCKVVSNFRVKDMAVGGEGAPLVPFSEYILYRSQKQAVALQNIGGIGNVTMIPKDCDMDDVFAFDTGPGNMMIDEAMRVFYGLPYDKNGDTAAKGKIINALQQELKEHPYIKAVPPKTTGREMFGAQYTNQIIERYSSEKKEDIVATLTWFTAYSIAQNYRLFIREKHDIQEVILGGGGAHNKTLIKMLEWELPDMRILTQEDKGYSSDAKEAIAFVILGNETLHGQYSNIPNATGASKKVILGNITYSD